MPTSERAAFHLPCPELRWNGTPQPGERVVLVAEQGLGDTIQFGRFAAVLAARGIDVTLLVRKAMAPLMSTLKGVNIVSDAAELAADKRPLRWLPLLSVPGVLGTTPETLPRDVPYLSADPARVQAWAERLGRGTFKIGINWAPGHADKTQTSRRDIPLANFAPLAALPGVELISLQKGAPAGEIAGVTVPRQDQDHRRRHESRRRFFPRYRRGDVAARSRDRLRYVGGASRRCAGAAGVHRAAGDFRLALDARTRRYALVSDHAALPAGRQPRLGAGARPHGGGFEKDHVGGPDRALVQRACRSTMAGNLE